MATAEAAGTVDISDDSGQRLLSEWMYETPSKPEPESSTESGEDEELEDDAKELKTMVDDELLRMYWRLKRMGITIKLWGDGGYDARRVDSGANTCCFSRSIVRRGPEWPFLGSDRHMRGQPRTSTRPRASRIRAVRHCRCLDRFCSGGCTGIEWRCQPRRMPCDESCDESCDGSPQLSLSSWQPSGLILEPHPSDFFVPDV